MRNEAIKHLLIPKQFAVYCRPSKPAGSLAITTEPPKATCANCLTRYRQSKGGKRAGFKVAHVNDSRPTKEHGEATNRCAVCGSPIYQESAVEGYSCSSCGSSDSDE